MTSLGTIKRLRGAVRAVDLVERTLAVAANGQLRLLYVPATCPVLLHGERVKFRLLQPRDVVDVAYKENDVGLTALRVRAHNGALPKSRRGNLRKGDRAMVATKTKVDRLFLDARVASDVMTSDPVSLVETATLRDAYAFLTDRGISAAPVIDEAGRPVGVISRADLVRYDRERLDYAPNAAPYFDPNEYFDRVPEGFQVERPDVTMVRDVMTPVVFSVTPRTPVTNVVEEMLARRVHRLFVIDPAGVLVGVISALDLLRHLRGQT